MYVAFVVPNRSGGYSVGAEGGGDYHDTVDAAKKRIVASVKKNLGQELFQAFIIDASSGKTVAMCGEPMPPIAWKDLS